LHKERFATKQSKAVSKYLRHELQVLRDAHFEVTRQGAVRVESLLAWEPLRDLRLSLELFRTSAWAARYDVFETDGAWWIRARQGHSDIDDSAFTELGVDEVPALAYHVTAAKNVDAIRAQGLKPAVDMTVERGRLHVYLADSVERATLKASYRGATILRLNLRQAAEGGVTVLRSSSGDLLVPSPGVPTQFILPGDVRKHRAPAQALPRPCGSTAAGPEASTSSSQACTVRNLTTEFAEITNAPTEWQWCSQHFRSSQDRDVALSIPAMTEEDEVDIENMEAADLVQPIRRTIEGIIFNRRVWPGMMSWNQCGIKDNMSDMVGAVLIAVWSGFLRVRRVDLSQVRVEEVLMKEADFNDRWISRYWAKLTFLDKTPEGLGNSRFHGGALQDLLCAVRGRVKAGPRQDAAKGEQKVAFAARTFQQAMIYAGPSLTMVQVADSNYIGNLLSIVEVTSATDNKSKSKSGYRQSVTGWQIQAIFLRPWESEKRFGDIGYRSGCSRNGQYNWENATEGSRAVSFRMSPRGTDPLPFLARRKVNYDPHVGVRIGDV